MESLFGDRNEGMGLHRKVHGYLYLNDLRKQAALLKVENIFQFPCYFKNLTVLLYSRWYFSKTPAMVGGCDTKMVLLW